MTSVALVPHKQITHPNNVRMIFKCASLIKSRKKQQTNVKQFVQRGFNETHIRGRRFWFHLLHLPRCWMGLMPEFCGHLWHNWLQSSSVVLQGHEQKTRRQPRTTSNRWGNVKKLLLEWKHAKLDPSEAHGRTEATWTSLHPTEDQPLLRRSVNRLKQLN